MDYELFLNSAQEMLQGSDREQELLDLVESKNLHIEVLEERIEKLRQELAEAYKEGYREGFLAAREQQLNRFK